MHIKACNWLELLNLRLLEPTYGQCSGTGSILTDSYVYRMIKYSLALK